jgi:hypothetical protein
MGTSKLMASTKQPRVTQMKASDDAGEAEDTLAEVGGQLGGVNLIGVM